MLPWLTRPARGQVGEKLFVVWDKPYTWLLGWEGGWEAMRGMGGIVVAW